MRVLFLGGTGNISTACVEHALARGHQVGILTRGQRPSLFGPWVEVLLGDRDEPGALGKAADGRWDAVVDFLAYTPAQVDLAASAFAGKTGQYVFIGTVAAYDKPNARLPFTEDAPLANPHWEYARLKIACEERVACPRRSCGPRTPTGPPGSPRASAARTIRWWTACAGASRSSVTATALRSGE
jgi:nucleoside-diphosphate-sugar epimerase